MLLLGAKQVDFGNVQAELGGRCRSLVEWMMLLLLAAHLKKRVLVGATNDFPLMLLRSRRIVTVDMAVIEARPTRV